ncbi:hypothetical protein ILUMI_27121 [Ignelater luminosus]|uniref:Uncharacterized protein n=1 Tax=Ignelater luminosus TaxID=2038154 RepID=A0A8K0FX22_IGNLU|nr:hypothetical protein ILUMI_27121 [Ignelater luminosus]
MEHPLYVEHDDSTQFDPEREILGNQIVQLLDCFEVIGTVWHWQVAEEMRKVGEEKRRSHVYQDGVFIL